MHSAVDTDNEAVQAFIDYGDVEVMGGCLGVMGLGLTQQGQLRVENRLLKGIINDALANHRSGRSFLRTIETLRVSLQVVEAQAWA